MGRNTIFGSGSVAELIRTKDWSATPLGPLDSWDASLLNAVNMVLAVPTPVQLLWGPEMVVLYNEAFLSLLAQKHPWALGTSALEVWAEAMPAVRAQLDAVFRDGVSFDFRDLPLELLNAKGELESNFFTFTYSPVRDAEGRIAGLLNLTQNTTSAVRAQALVAQSERRFRSLVHNASVGVAIGKLTGELTYLNPALLDMLHYSAEDVTAGLVRWDRLTPERYAQADMVAIQQLQATGVAEPYEKAYFNKEGVPVPVLIGAAVMPPSEELAGDGDIAVFATDLRKQKRAEGALVQSEKLAAVGKLASSISHEINNPLEAVTNLLYVVQQDENLSQPSRDFLATADRELARMAQVTSQTLRFHRQSTRPLCVDARQLTSEVMQIYAARLRNRGIRVKTKNRDGAELTCYEGDIRQVLNNLVGNAVDAIRNDGQIWVRTRSARRGSTGEEGVLLTIADNGSGMNEKVRRHIFEAFYTTKGMHGTGLGLWISYRIVHKHRGYIRCYSVSGPTRHGTVFQIWLPKVLAATAWEAWHENEMAELHPERTH